MQVASGFSQGADAAVLPVRKNAGIGGASSPNTFLEMGLWRLGNKMHDAFCQACETPQSEFSGVLTADKCLAMIGKAPWLLAQYPWMLNSFPWLKNVYPRMLEAQAYKSGYTATLH